MRLNYILKIKHTLLQLFYVLSAVVFLLFLATFSCQNSSKAEKEIGFKCKIGLEEGLTNMILWTKKNKEFIKGCINKHSYFME